MRILLTNDDGIHAPGLEVLEAIARTLSDDIWIVAPSEEQSGAGHSLTLSRPVRLRKHEDRRFSVSGTPTDAALFDAAGLDAGVDATAHDAFVVRPDAPFMAGEPMKLATKRVLGSVLLILRSSLS